MERAQLLESLAQYLLGRDPGHPLRTAVDGVDAAGKTILADDLARVMEGRGRQILRSSVDYFHYPAALRHKNSSTTPESYYQDSFDYATLVEVLLRPLGPGANRACRTGVYDYRVEAPLETLAISAAPDAILLFDGIFLQRPELAPYWDVTIFLQVDFEETVARAARRDQYLFGNEDQVRARYLQRYVPGQRMYLAQCRPAERADVLIDNHDPLHPELLRGWEEA
ncbi:MAG: uridine kinase [Anaerolineae bacterium]|nr:uridine kinase [Anaerolineae bacterium]